MFIPIIMSICYTTSGSQNLINSDIKLKMLCLMVNGHTVQSRRMIFSLDTWKMSFGRCHSSQKEHNCNSQKRWKSYSLIKVIIKELINIINCNLSESTRVWFNKSTHYQRTTHSSYTQLLKIINSWFKLIYYFSKH